MLTPFVLIPLAVCLYEIFSLIIPLRLPVWAKILASLLLLSGLAKTYIRRTSSGFEIFEMSYLVTLITTIIFNFIIVALFTLLIKDAAYIISRIILHKAIPGHYASLFVFSIALVATIYGTWEALRLPDVKAQEVRVKGLGQELDGLRVALLADIHADILTNGEFVQKIVDRTNSLKPDIVLIAGDFVDGRVSERLRDIEPLKNLRAGLGVYGSTGNHEYYYDYYGWKKTLPELGVKMLTSEHVEISSGDSKLVIAGLPDPTGQSMGLDSRSLSQALEGVPENVPVILMDHQPREARENAKMGVSLQVSGHTHGGQMPGIYSLVKRANGGFVRGGYDVDEMRLYVSPGTSQWNGFACRIFDPSEITLFTLKSE